MATTVGSALNWWARAKPDVPAIVVAEEELTYRELHHWTGRVARTLAERGVRPGDRVGLAAANCLEWPVAALAILKCGAVLVPLNPRLKGAEIRKVADEAGLSAVLAAEAQMPAVEAARAGENSYAIYGFDVIAEHRSGPADGFRIDPALTDPISIIFTSGSTGASKGVVLTSRTLLDIVLENTLTEDGFAPGTTALLLLPLAFTPGLLFGLLMRTVLGGTLVIEPDLNPARAVGLIEKRRVKALFGVPLIFESLSRTAEFADADLSSLETAIVGGAAVPRELLSRWADKGVLLRQIYGMTEAGGVATATVRADALAHPESCGNGSIFTEVRVMTDDGTFAAPGEPGELVVRGPGVTPGYWQDPETTAEAIRDGWLHSGDLGVCDDAGRITFVDRLKDLIISGGINISPIEVEGAIAGLAGIEEVAVIPAPDPRFGETPAAIVVRSPGRNDVDENLVVTHCDEILASYKVPRYVVIRDSPLPRLASGKIAKRLIRDEYHDIAERFSRTR